MTTIEGSTAAGFEDVREAFTKAQQEDVGSAQLAVYHRGEQVVDLWTADDDFSGESLSVLMSVSKGVTATCAHMLVQEGLLDVAAPVAAYWPEFAQAGKERVTVAEVLSHRAGLSGFEPAAGIGVPELADWQRCVAALAAMEPLWEPGTRVHYHALTFGYLVGEIIERVSGRSVGTFLAERIAGPLGLDLWIGLPAAQEPRVVPSFSSLTGPPPAPPAIDPTSRFAQMLIAGAARMATAFEAFNTSPLHAAEIPAAGGIGNARSIARLYAATIGEVDGVRLLDAATVEAARTPLIDGLALPDPIAALPNPHPQRMGLGYELSRSATPMVGAGSFGHAGAGGRLGFADPENGVAVGYVCTNMTWDPNAGPDPRWEAWTPALREAVAAER